MNVDTRPCCSLPRMDSRRPLHPITEASVGGPKRSFVPASRSSNRSRRPPTTANVALLRRRSQSARRRTVQVGRDGTIGSSGAHPAGVVLDSTTTARSCHTSLGCAARCRLGRAAALSCGVELRAEDVDQQWMLSPSTGADGVVVEAPVSVLALWLWQRVALDDPRIRLTGPNRKRDELSAANLTP